MKKRIFKLFKIIGMGIPFLLFCPLTILYIYGHYINVPPSDQALARDFKLHRAAYEELRTLIQEETRIDGVSPRYVMPIGRDRPPFESPEEAGIPLDRYKHYLALLDQVKAIDVQNIPCAEQECPRVCIQKWAKPRAHFYICRMTHKPAESDTRPENAEPRPWYKPDTFPDDEPTYRHIDGQWYRLYDY